MTRFARAKGSKSSNERIPESATSWKVMKKELEKTQNEVKNSQERKKINQIRQQSYDDFLEDTISKVEKKWVEFPKAQVTKVTKKKNQKKGISKSLSKDAIKDMLKPDKVIDAKVVNLKNKIEKVLNKKPKKSAKDSNDAPEEINSKTPPAEIIVKKALKRLNRKNALKIKRGTAENGDKPNPTTFKSRRNGKGPNFKHGQKHPNQKGNLKNGKFQKRKVAKTRDDNPHKRRKPDQKDQSITTDGVTQDLVKYEGFPVTKSDHDRLTNLHKLLTSNGIPESIIGKTMKLERRKAEKNVARLRKTVCFKCRKSGHMLSDCPTLVDANQVSTEGMGICFKCGSAEHSYTQCRLKTQGFKYAHCFICKEQGHIARECPDNPRGLYPDGGACMLCGDVTHLKKDCPQRMKEQQENSVFVDTIASDDLERLGEEKEVLGSAKKRVVKF